MLNSDSVRRHRHLPANNPKTAPSAIVPEVQEEPVTNSSITKKPLIKDAQAVDLVLRQFRCLIADLCQQFNGGHPG